MKKNIQGLSMAKLKPVIFTCLIVCSILINFSLVPSGKNSEADEGKIFQSIQPQDFSNKYLFGLEEVFWDENITGAGQKIAIVDTGINPHHEVFSGKSIDWFDVSNETEPIPTDLDGHGTMCASIATGNSSTYKGSAPGSDIAAIKMFVLGGDGETTAENEDATAAVDYLIANKTNLGINIASISWGDDNESDGEDFLSKEVERLVDAGFMTFVSAGNLLTNVDNVAAPGTARKVITVGSLNEVGFEVAYFSLVGPTADGRIKPDVIAPGVHVTGASHVGNTSYKTGRGTSYSTPIVSGMAALLLEQYSWLDHYSLKHLLCMTATESEYTSGNPDNKEGWGLVNPAGIRMAIENTWDLQQPLNVSLDMAHAINRTYFSRIELEAGKTHQFKLEMKDSTGNTSLTNLYQAYLYDANKSDYGSPILLSRDHNGLMFYQPSISGEYIIAIKPKPLAWLEYGNIQFHISIIHSTNQIILISKIMAGIFLTGAIALGTWMARGLIQNRRRNLAKLID